MEYWQKFRGRKLGYKTGSDWTDRQIARHQRFRFTHININSDFLDEWGFVAGDRVKINIRKKMGFQQRPGYVGYNHAYDQTAAQRNNSCISVSPSRLFI